MKRSRFTEEQIIGLLKEREARMPTAAVCRKHGIRASWFYLRRKMLSNSPPWLSKGPCKKGWHILKNADDNMSGNGIVYHDYFAIRGGGERLVLSLANALGFGVVGGFVTEDSYEPGMFPVGTTDLRLPSFLRKPGIRPVALAFLFARQKKKAAGYAVRIFSGVAAPFAAPAVRDGLNIFYCHTPPRFLYDQKQHFLTRLPQPVKLIAKPVLWWFEMRYRAALSRMDVIVTNSETTRVRLSKYVGLQSIVVNPPVDTDSFKWRPDKGYYLSTARLSPLKRVDMIVEAFLHMPEKNLVVASGGDELERLKAIASGAPHIEFCGWVDDKKLKTLVSESIATIYLPRDEDFGMSPVESMAAGKPVIGVAEGGLLETIIDGETGVLLDPEFGSQDIVEAVTAMTEARALGMRKACEKRSKEFTTEKFLEQMIDLLAGSVHC